MLCHLLDHIIKPQGINERMAMYTQKVSGKSYRLFNRLICETKKSHIILLPISKKQLADYFGVQRPSLFRELKRMRMKLNKN